MSVPGYLRGVVPQATSSVRPLIVSNQVSAPGRNGSKMMDAIGAGLGVLAMSYLVQPVASIGSTSLAGFDISNRVMLATVAGAAEYTAETIESYLPSQVSQVGVQQVGLTVGDAAITGVAPVAITQVASGDGFNKGGLAETGMDSAKVFVGSKLGKYASRMLW